MIKQTIYRRLLVIIALSLFTTAAFATVTSSGIRGVVTDEGDRPVAGVNVVVRSVNTSLTRSAQTNAGGGFTIRNLPVGDNYTVTANSAGYNAGSVENISLVLGQVANLKLVLISAGAIEEVVVTGSRLKAQVALGPSASFGLRELENNPAINRNIADILRIDPRVYVDESRGDINSIQCGGKNPRFNSLTLDGVRTNDSFGLNSNGYPTERMPFPYEAVNQVSVELAPFDARYGGFSACNINAVTKSGSNEFTGSFFYDYTDNDLRADKLEGDEIKTGDYDEIRYGITFGGPIIQDKLFFFVAYEKLEGANLFDRGPLGSGAVNEVDVAQADLDEIARIAREVYQYDPGPIPASLDTEDEKYMMKLDWYINDRHRAAFTYSYNDGHNFTQSDGDLNEFEFANHLYERGAELNSYVGTLYSNWTDNFSTEIRIGYLELDNRQNSIGGTDFGEIRVELNNREGLGDVDVYLGGDDSRQANNLYYDLNNYLFRGNYAWNEHNISFGIEREELDIFNLFIQHTETEIRFKGIDNFRDGYASAIYYNNSPSHTPNDAAADWAYEITSLFVQDEFDLTEDITLVAGLRYDRYSSDDAPITNPAFLEEYGFSNSGTVDGEGLLQPRLGFTWYLSDQLTVRGGVGRYSGGNPNVWLSNNYSNNNVLQFGQRGRSFNYTNGSRSLFDPDVVYKGVEPGVPEGPGYGIPGEIYDAVSEGEGANFEINYLDPGFDLPSEWKFALGLTYVFENGMQVQADTLWAKGEDSAMVLHGDLEQTGVNEAGYPVYDSPRDGSYVLTNSDEGSKSFTASVFFSQAYDNGVDWTFGYAYNDAEDAQPMTSSVAHSNYQNRAFFDPQEDVLSTSDYNIEHRFTAVVNWEKAWFGDNPTIISLYGSLNQEPSYSNTVDGNGIYNFNPFLEDGNVLPPGSERNGNDGSWWGKVDFKIEQQLALGPGNASVFLVIDNLTNLINDDWGILETVDFPNNVTEGDTAEPRVGDASRYEIRFGVRYAF